MEWRDVDNMGPIPHYSLFKLWQLHWRFCWTKSNLRLQIGVDELISFDMKLQIQLIQCAQYPLIWEWQIVQGPSERFLQWRSNSKNNFTGNQSLFYILQEISYPEHKSEMHVCQFFQFHVSCMHGTAVGVTFIGATIYNLSTVISLDLRSHNLVSPNCSHHFNLWFTSWLLWRDKNEFLIWT